jgi:hypothetical protein
MLVRATHTKYGHVRTSAMKTLRPPTTNFDIRSERDAHGEESASKRVYKGLVSKKCVKALKSKTRAKHWHRIYVWSTNCVKQGRARDHNLQGTEGACFVSNV